MLRKKKLAINIPYLMNRKKNTRNLLIPEKEDINDKLLVAIIGM